MGTRSLTTVIDRNREILVMYRQFDGYPSGHGDELAKWAKGMKIVNGLIVGDKSKKANGMGCLAAQMVAFFKKDAEGGFYILAPETREAGEEYVYNLSERDGRIWLDLQEGEIAFFGLPGTKPELMDYIYSGWLDDFDGATVERGEVHHAHASK